MKRIPVTLPPPAEQAAIVRFLDHADRRIRKAIAAKQRLIKLLQEQKQVIIHQAVTRGLDPDVKLKPSGVEWLGDVPEGWEIEDLGRISQIRSVKNPGNLSLLSVFLDRGVIPYEEGGGQVHAPSLDLSNYQVVQQGDLVLNNQQAWRGSVGVSRLNGIISPAYIILELNRRLESSYANLLFRSRALVQQYVISSKGVGDIQRHLYWPYLKRVRVLIPPAADQQAIIHHIEAESVKLDQAIARAQSEISLLREYRTRLIADVVTGKLDVREAAAQLPEPEQGNVPEDLEDEEVEVEAEGTESSEEDT